VNQTTTEPDIARRAGVLRFGLRLLSCIRFDEVRLLQGATVIGAAFSIGALTAHNLLVVAAVVAGNVCLVAHVFLLNDWSGIDSDLRDPTRAAGTFLAKGVSRTEIGYLAMGLLALSLAFFGLVGAAPLLMAAAIAALSALYSAPFSHLKGVPLCSSALHLLGGALHFLLGYSAFEMIDGRGLAISGFFGLVFAAGHLTHQARDLEGDWLNAIRTTAVAFGKTRSFFGSLALFTLAYALLAALAVWGLVPFVLVLALALYPFHLYAAWRALRAGLTYESLRRLQANYRGIFALIGITMLVTAPFSW